MSPSPTKITGVNRFQRESLAGLGIADERFTYTLTTITFVGEASKAARIIADAQAHWTGARRGGHYQAAHSVRRKFEKAAGIKARIG